MSISINREVNIAKRTVMSALIYETIRATDTQFGIKLLIYPLQIKVIYNLECDALNTLQINYYKAKLSN